MVTAARAVPGARGCARIRSRRAATWRSHGACQSQLLLAAYIYELLTTGGYHLLYYLLGVSSVSSVLHLGIPGTQCLGGQAPAEFGPRRLVILRRHPPRRFGRLRGCQDFCGHTQPYPCRPTERLTIQALLRWKTAEALKLYSFLSDERYADLVDSAGTAHT